jgi:hypothetical protein
LLVATATLPVACIPLFRQGQGHSTITQSLLVAVQRCCQWEYLLFSAASVTRQNTGVDCSGGRRQRCQWQTLLFSVVNEASNLRVAVGGYGNVASGVRSAVFGRRAMANNTGAVAVGGKPISGRISVFFEVTPNGRH